MPNQTCEGDWEESARTAAPKSLRVSSGSALLRSPQDVAAVFEALAITIRSSNFSEREVFGIRMALEAAIQAVFQTVSDPVRLRYHLGPDGLLLDVEPQGFGSARLSEKTVQMIQHFMTEVRVHDRGVTLYSRHSQLS